MKVRKLLNEMLKGKTSSVSVTGTAGTFNVTSCDAILVGNTLRLYFAATAKEAKTAGNITNETMLTINVNDDRIVQAFHVAGTFGTSGPLASLQFSGFTTGNAKTITVTLCALAQNIADGGTVNSYVAIPVERKLGGVLSNIVFYITHLFERRCVA